MAEAVYILCALTSLACAVLLARSYSQTRTSLLFWSSICFVALALNNALLVIDLLVVRETDLSIARTLIALAGVCTMIFGLVWKTGR